jgi:hypothetical protein
MTALETDYLVVGAGAAGMAFTDEVVSHSEADVLLVDRREAPGGHWNDAYPFVRLHLPSPLYGVNSRRLGADRIDDDGPNAGMYERATGAEVRDYYRRLLAEQFVPSGRVGFLGLHDVSVGPDGRCQVTSRLTGETRDVLVRRKVVDAAYLETSVPSTHAPSFGVADGVRFVLWPTSSVCASRQPVTSSSVPVRRRSTPASGCGSTMCRRSGSAGFDRATRGC